MGFFDFLNTVTSLPRRAFIKASSFALDTAKDVGRGMARNVASAGISLSQPISQRLGDRKTDSLSREDVPGFMRDSWSTLFGPEPVKSVELRINDAEKKIRNSRFAQKTGAAKHARGLALGGVLLTTGLDLTPFGGSAKGAAKTLVTSKTTKEAAEILTKMGVDSATQRAFAPIFAQAKTQKEVEGVLETMRGILGSKYSSERFAPIEQSTGRLLSVLRETAKPARTQLETAYSAERARRAGVLKSIQQKEGGRETALEGLRSLSGELASRPDIEPLKLGSGDVDNLFNAINANGWLTPFEKIAGSKGLLDLMDGRIPNNSQIEVLEQVFGTELAKEILSKRGASKLSAIANWTNVPRAVMATGDMSAVFRQGAVLSASHPVLATKAFGDALIKFFSPKYFDAWYAAVRHDNTFQLAKESGLDLTGFQSAVKGLAGREERFQTDLAQRIPLFGRIIKASERHYTGFLDKLRYDSFKQISAKWIKDGLDPRANADEFEGLARFLNSASGRGDLGRANAISPVLNSVFFSARYQKARLDFLNPRFYSQLPKRARIEAIKSFAEFVGVVSSVAVLAKMSGAEVEIDPRSSDFGKIKVGNTRWDPWAGFSQWGRFFAQMATGERKTSTGNMQKLDGEAFPFDTRFDVLTRFGRTKLAPIPGLVADMLDGNKNLVGEEVTLSKEFTESVIPLYLQDISDAISEMGPEALFLVGVPAFLGVGTQTYKNPSEFEQIRNNSSGSNLDDIRKEVYGR